MDKAVDGELILGSMLKGRRRDFLRVIFYFADMRSFLPSMTF